MTQKKAKEACKTLAGCGSLKEMVGLRACFSESFLVSSWFFESFLVSSCFFFQILFSKSQFSYLGSGSRKIFIP